MKTIRLKVTVRGTVQGVGFRPFVFRLVNQMRLAGWVSNSAQGVFIEVEGEKPVLVDFLNRLEREKPPRSFIQSLETSWLDPAGFKGFEIRESESGGVKSALVMPDLGTCADCLAEILDPQNRRYGYPFTNCTNCGPRFSIIESLPYDRANTSMKHFKMCPQCQAEYDNPADRRFHAQPNACPICGPRLELWNGDGTFIGALHQGEDLNKAHEAEQSRRLEACARGTSVTRVLEAAANLIRASGILAAKGLGGFHLIAAAGDDSALHKLRQRKHREEKPFAVMFSSLETVRKVCHVSPVEERLLRSPEAPIVLLSRLSAAGNILISQAVAPGNPNLGVMLPYTPLHHLLLGQLRGPVVATSGNLADEPICIDEHEALDRLRGIADSFLVHNRPIVRHVDDSIVRVMAGREVVLRRARGYAPLPIQVRSVECGVRSGKGEMPDVRDGVPSAECAVGTLKGDVPNGGSDFIPTALAASCSENSALLAVGAHLKNTIALAVGPQVFISQHIGDLETSQAYDAFRRVIADLQRLYDAPAARVVADAHPDYLSTRFAQDLELPCAMVQHHVAHVLACMAENEIEPPALGISWDGTGYGLDGTVWGGEFFQIQSDGPKRIAHLRQFPLPGGQQAIKEPRRSALGLLFAAFGEGAFALRDLPISGAFSSGERDGLKKMLVRKLNSPLTSSIGRLFDAVASLVGVRQRVGFEGQAAMDLEFLIGNAPDPATYDLPLTGTALPLILNWQPCLDALLATERVLAVVTQIRHGVAGHLQPFS